MTKHRYNLIRFDTATAGTSYKLFVRSLYDYVIVKEVTTSDVTERSYFVAAKGLETSWTNRASLTYSEDIQGRKLVNEGQNWLAAAGRTFTGLLDTYGGAAAAYSLQLLSSDYSGNCVTVRRASDNATLDIGFSNNELDISTLETFCASTDGYVTSWFDQSGNGFNAVQTTASSQPQIVSSGSVLLEGGLPSINFDGVDDDIVAANLTTELDSSPFSIFTVSRNGRYGIVGAVPRLYLNESTYSYNNLSIISWIRDDYALRSYFAKSDNTHEVFENSISKGTATETLVNFAPTNFLLGRTGGSYTLNKIQAVIIYNSDQSGNRTGIETVLNDYYSIY